MLSHRILHQNLLKILLVFFLTNLLSHVFAQTSLGIKQDQEAKRNNRYIWSSVATFEKDNTEIFSNAELYGLAKQAYEDMEADWERQNTPGWLRPAVMSAMGIGTEIYFSSSIKGKNFVYQESNRHKEVVVALNQCQVALQEKLQKKVPDGEPVKEKHKTGASCGEVMIVHQYYVDPQKPDLGPSRMVAYGRPGGQGDPESLRPCGGIDKNKPDLTTWGCKQFMDSEKISVPDKVVPVTKTPFVAPKSTRQVVIC